VRLEQMMVRAHCRRQTLFGRRPDAEQVRVRGEHVRLVDGDPESAKVTQRVHRDARESRQPFRELVGEQSPALRQPEGQREVMERHHGLDACVAETTEHTAVRVERGSIDLAIPGLDSRPLDRHAVGAQAQRPLDEHVTLPEAPGVARDVRSVPVLDATRLLCECVPVAGGAASLDLGCGRRRAEDK
jgi:hypothetical protein